MKLVFKNTFLGYFQYYYNIIGNKFLINLALSITISFFDGLGLAMFIPLLQAVGDDGVVKESGDSTNMNVFTDLIHILGFELNITTILIFLVSLFVLKGLMKFLQLNYQVNIRQLFMKKVRFTLVDSLQNLSYRGFLKLDAGRIQNTLTSEVQKLFQSMNYYFTAAQSMVMLMTYVVLAFFANYQFAFLVAVGAGLSNLIYRRIYIYTKKASLALSKEGNDFNGFLIQSIHYFKYLKSTNYSGAFSLRIKRIIDKTELLNHKMGFYGAITQAVREPLIIIIVAFVILVQVKMMGTGLSTIILSLLLFYRSLSFLMVVQNNWQGFIQNIGAMDAVASITYQMEAEKEIVGSIKINGISENIELNDVTFGYNEFIIINNLSITIPKNKTIALIGESGSGKSTLANLIAGLIDPNKGNLLIDKIDIKQIDINTYRSQIGYISQEPVIFNDNIYNNITFWSERTPENIVRFNEVLKLSSLEDFIISQPDKEFTNLGDNGILISGGQKQRISIARELFKKVDVLIFDEATSALDSETERVIQDNVNNLHGKYTIVIIAHRLSTIKDADVIHLMENGNVKDCGTFDELMEKSLKFRNMVRLQEF